MNKTIKLRATAKHPTRKKDEIYHVTAIQAASDAYQRHADFAETDLEEPPLPKRKYKRRDMTAE